MLERVARVLRDNPKLNLLVTGHTDDQGDDQFNVDLSRLRAQWVAGWLVGQGVAAGRIEHAGLVPTRPRVANDSPFNRALNRRVELHFSVR